MTETLTCEGCGKRWERERARGRKPRFCSPECWRASPGSDAPASPELVSEPLACMHGVPFADTCLRCDIVASAKPAAEPPPVAPSAPLREFWRVMLNAGPLFHGGFYGEAEARAVRDRLQAEELPRTEGGAIWRLVRCEVIE